MLSQLVISTLLLVNPLVCHPTSSALVVRSAHNTDPVHGASLDGSDLGRRRVPELDSSSHSAGLGTNSTNPKPSTHDLEFLSLYTQKHDVAKNLSRHEDDKSDSTLDLQKFTPDQLDIIRGIELELMATDLKCALQNENGKKAETRSLELEERQVFGPHQIPSNFLFDAEPECLIVGMGLSDYLPWTGTRSGQSVIGTIGLCGCIAVAILSNDGAVVSHLITRSDLSTQLNLMFAKFLSMHGQYDIQAYVFTPETGEAIPSELAAVARVVAMEVRGFIISHMQCSVVLSSYAVGGDSPEYARLGTLVTTRVQGVIKLWVNDALIHR
ncbi:hypothetical protein G7Y79_00016g040530 [Physcia stellaris]|nr:hypothetical protein G7Y79_00016g040530 [Physcia stellaris]